MMQLQTGIDKLMALIREKKKLTVKEAAQLLGVSHALIEEWANFLEEEGFIIIDYGFAKTVLKDKQFSEEQLTKKKKHIEAKKEQFIENVQTTFSQMQKQEKEIQELKEAYDQLVKAIGNDMKKIQNDWQSLKQLQQERASLEQTMLHYEDSLQEKIKRTSNLLKKEEQRFAWLTKQIGKETAHLHTDELWVAKLKRAEEQLLQRLLALEKKEEHYHQLIKKEEQETLDHHYRLKKLKEDAQHLTKEILETKALLQKLEEEKKQREKETKEKLMQMLKKIQKEKQTLKKDTQHIMVLKKQFTVFLKKHTSIQRFVEKTNKQMQQLAKDMDHLLDQIERYQVLSNVNDAERYAKEIKTLYEAVQKKQSEIQKNYHKIIGLMQQKR